MTAQHRPKVAVIFGGRSSEHGVSCLTAREVLSVIDAEHYDVTAVGIARDGRWVRETLDWPHVEGSLPEVRGDLEPFAVDSLSEFDVAFPLLHGPWGEDGTVQGLFEMLDIRYVGAGVLASAAAMDKPFTKTLFSVAGLPQLPYVTLLPHQWETEREKSLSRIEGLRFPVFVKPARAGSSAGVTRVVDSAGISAAIEQARKHDPKVVIESAAREPRELECAVIQRPDGTAEASVVGEITVADGAHDFYDFESKYLDGSSTNVVPADVADDVSGRIRGYAVKAFEAIGGEGLARVDFFDSADGLVINEINTMPGFTPFSMFPLLWEASGVAYAELVDRLLQLALARPTGLR